jgi:enamine deaminase RidA (YjgF/YER057c/UK114 family)
VYASFYSWQSRVAGATVRAPGRRGFMSTACTNDVTRARESLAGGELTLLTWPGSAAATESAAEEAYAAIDGMLRERGSVPIQERVFAERRAGAALLRGRARAVGGAVEWASPPTCVEGAPVGRAGLAGIHVIAARGTSIPVVEADRVLGSVVETREARILGLSDAGRAGGRPGAADPSEDAGIAIESAARLLEREGFSFHDVARTWFYLRDILDWYGPFNAVRSAAFQRMGLLGRDADGQIPASTGIAGGNHRGGWCALDLIALRRRDGGRFEMKRLHNRKQNEATEYGSSFARAMEVRLGDTRYVFVSGTASIDDHGATVHAGDFEAQARHTLAAVEALLEGAGASLADVAQATAFLTRPGQGPAFERLREQSGLRAPLVTMIADVCRADLLFEIDAVAVVPPGRGART